MRDIKKVMERANKIDPFGITMADPVEFMTFEQARPYLTEDAIEKYESGKEKWTYEKYTPENVSNKIKDYIEFAWDKANDGRGLSAYRSLLHFSNWFYMFGNEPCDELAESLLDYEYYGKPWLVIISELLDIDWRKYDDGWWTNCDLCDGVLTEDATNIIEEYRQRIRFDEIKQFINSINAAKKTR